MSAGLVIAGGGLAAQRCCETLRAAGDTRPVTILASEPELPYDRPPLSKDALGSGAQTAFRPAGWHAGNGIDLRLGEAAAELDAARRIVVTSAGRRVRYDDLLVATGAVARELPALAPFANVAALRTRMDAARLRAALAAGGPLAVVGAGLIGLEAAATAARLGVTVTVIEAAPRPLSGVLGPLATGRLVALHRQEGVTIRAGVQISAVRGRSVARELRLDDGTSVPCGHVLVGVGVRPASEWLAGSGLGGTIVRADGEGRTALPHVFAAGDVTGAGHWEAAARGGAAVAAALLGRVPKPFGPASFWTDQHGLRLVCAGDPRAGREVVVHDDPASGAFELDHIDGGNVCAVVLAGRPPSARRAARARLGTPHHAERTAA